MMAEATAIVARNGYAPGPSAAAPALTFRTLALAAVSDVVEGDAPELEYLRARREIVAACAPTWVDALISYLHATSDEDRPMLAMVGELGLSAMEVLAVALAALVEDDARAGRAMARAQAPLGGSRPTLALVAAALERMAAPGERPVDTIASGEAVGSGVLRLLNDAAPLPERTLAVPPALVQAMAGRDGVWPGITVGLDDVAEVPLAPSLLDTAARQARGLIVGGRALVLRIASRAEGRSLACAVAAALGLRAAFVDGPAAPPGLGPWLSLRGLVPVACLDLGPGERAVLPALPGYVGPRLVLAGSEGTVETASGGAVSWTIPVPTRDERARLWIRALGEGAEPLAADLARHHRHGCGRIAQLGRLARQAAAVDGRDRPEADDLRVAAWTGEGGGLDALAQPLTDAIPDEALVLPPSTRAELDALRLRCRMRDGLVDGLGPSAVARYRPGVRALFVGPSGTGKTLAAGWLATRLGMPLYRVDLASVTSKYIGETEKNLAQLLARAEQAEVILLFDEADSLFGRRTEVREANDRFANAQTNYLLQRIESFDGITLLTSNSRSRFDSAFSRRLDAVVEFASPGPEERRDLWRAHLGESHTMTGAELNRLSATADLVGGEIRNAVLAAAAMARASGRPLGFADVVAGVEAEFRKLGRQMPHGLIPASPGGSVPR